MASAKKEDWKTLDPPETFEELGYEAVFTDADFDVIQQGIVPAEMEDKWFVYYVDGELFLHRSWTGALIYWLRLDGSPAGVRVTESWVCRDPEQYRETDTSYDRMMLNFLLRGFILGQDVDFPIRSDDLDDVPAGVFQHSMIGRAYPEVDVSSKKLSLFGRFWSFITQKK